MLSLFFSVLSSYSILIRLAQAMCGINSLLHITVNVLLYCSRAVSIGCVAYLSVGLLCNVPPLYLYDLLLILFFYKTDGVGRAILTWVAKRFFFCQYSILTKGSSKIQGLPKSTDVVTIDEIQ